MSGFIDPKLEQVQMSATGQKRGECFPGPLCCYASTGTLSTHRGGLWTVKVHRRIRLVPKRFSKKEKDLVTASKKDVFQDKEGEQVVFANF